LDLKSELQFNKCKISDIQGNVPHATAMGPFGSNIKTENYVSSGVPIIRGKNILNGYYDGTELVYLTEEKADELSGSNTFPEDVLLVAQGNVGHVGYIPKDSKNNRFVLSQNLMKITIDQKKAIPLFIFYYLRSPEGQQEILQYQNPTGVPCLAQPLTSFRNILIPLPGLNIQKKIVEYLLNLDHEIQNLQNQNKILEQMAQAIFKSWFIDFDGVTEFEDSELGKIPKGWSVKMIKDFCKVRRGASPRPVGDPKYFGGNIPWIKIADVSKSPSPYLFSTKETVTEEGAKKSVHLPKNSLIISNSGTVGKPIFLTRDGCIHDGWLYFENLIEISQEFLYFYLLTLTAHLNLMGDGTVQKNLNTTIVGEIKFVFPKKKHLDSFLKTSQIFLKNIKENQIKINTLTLIRDALLPKLMSGKIRV
jgi:type I restriction enzyme, S subunit